MRSTAWGTYSGKSEKGTFTRAVWKRQWSSCIFSSTTARLIPKGDTGSPSHSRSWARLRKCATSFGHFWTRLVPTRASSVKGTAAGFTKRACCSASPRSRNPRIQESKNRTPQSSWILEFLDSWIPPVFCSGVYNRLQFRTLYYTAVTNAEPSLFYTFRDSGREYAIFRSFGLSL